MKKILLVGAIALFGAMNAQTGFKLGAHIGLPTGDANTAYSFSLGADVAYMWPVSAEFNLGLVSGYTAFTGKTVSGYKVPSLSLVPLAAAAQYNVSPQFSIGADLGYGFLFASGTSDGGFYYQPKVAYHFGPSEVNFGYMGVTKSGSTISAVNLGYAYSFGK
ncbi:hypothetical protein [Halpernia sp.]|uniref:hypothetical protein n=1 Tax=Halpernia sp. TaxID=2782209 RepID=UPI003A8F378F